MINTKYIILFTFTVFLFTNLTKAEQSFTSQEIIDILNDYNKEKIVSIGKFINDKWQDNQIDDIENFNKLLLYCYNQEMNFNWEKYLALTSTQFKELSQEEMYKLDIHFFRLNILAQCYVIHKKESIKFYKEIKSKQKLKELFIKLIFQAKLDLKKNEAKQMLKADLKTKLQFLLSYFKEKATDRNNNFLVGISNDKEFLATLKKDEESKEKILSLVKNEFPKIINTDQTSRAIRRAFINIYIVLETPEESLKWLEGVLEMPNVSDYEKSIIKRNIITSLKFELEN